MATLALNVLTLTLGLFFILVGHFKVTPKFFPDIYEDMRHEFGRFNKVFPFYKITGWRPYARNFRLTIGIIEMVCGAILIIMPGRLKLLANTMLLLVTLGAVYSHYTSGDKFDRMAPAIIFSLLLFTRLIIYYQGKRSNANIKSEQLTELNNETENNQPEPVDEKPVEKKKSLHTKKKK